MPEVQTHDENSGSAQNEEFLPELSDEVIKIITKADDLIAYQIPEEVIYHTEPEEDPFAFAHEDSDEPDEPTEEDSMMEKDISESSVDNKKPTKHFADQTRGKKIRKFL